MPFLDLKFYIFLAYEKKLVLWSARSENSFVIVTFRICNEFVTKNILVLFIYYIVSCGLFHLTLSFYQTDDRVKSRCVWLTRTSLFIYLFGLNFKCTFLHYWHNWFNENHMLLDLYFFFLAIFTQSVFRIFFRSTVLTFTDLKCLQNLKLYPNQIC